MGSHESEPQRGTGLVLKTMYVEKRDWHERESSKKIVLTWKNDLEGWNRARTKVKWISEQSCIGDEVKRNSWDLNGTI